MSSIYVCIWDWIVTYFLNEQIICGKKSTYVLNNILIRAYVLKNVLIWVLINLTNDNKCPNTISTNC